MEGRGEETDRELIGRQEEKKEGSRNRREETAVKLVTRIITMTHLIDCKTVSLCSAAFTLIFSSRMSLFSRSILALKYKILLCYFVSRCVFRK